MNSVEKITATSRDNLSIETWNWIHSVKSSDSILPKNYEELMLSIEENYEL